MFTFLTNDRSRFDDVLRIARPDDTVYVATRGWMRERDFSGEAGREHRVDPAWSVQLG
jgi:hypothetical protein